MNIKFGEIDAAQIVDNEYRAKLALKIIDWMLKNSLPEKKPTQDEVKKMQDEVISELQQKYPNSGVGLVR